MCDCVCVVRVTSVDVSQGYGGTRVSVGTTTLSVRWVVCGREIDEVLLKVKG